MKNNKIIKKKMKNKEKESVPSQQFHGIFRIQRTRMQFYLIWEQNNNADILSTSLDIHINSKEYFENK